MIKKKDVLNILAELVDKSGHLEKNAFISVFKD